jgi:hypothetical protein
MVESQCNPRRTDTHQGVLPPPPRTKVSGYHPCPGYVKQASAARQLGPGAVGQGPAKLTKPYPSRAHTHKAPTTGQTQHNTTVQGPPSS